MCIKMVGLRAPLFLDAKKAGPNANTNATIFPGLRKCFHICPGLIELKVEKNRQGALPPEPYSAPGHFSYS